MARFRCALNDDQRFTPGVVYAARNEIEITTVRYQRRWRSDSARTSS